MSDDEILFDHDVLRGHCEALLRALGVPDDKAALVADTLIEADLRGVRSHGTHLVALYVDRFRAGSILPDAPIDVVHDEGSTVLLDANLGLGQIAGVHAIDLAVERAKIHGVAAVSVRECTHLGALGYYTLRAAKQNCMAMLVQNGPAFVPPFGGLTGMFSTNPYSYALPACEEAPIVFDIATTAVAGNKILLAKKNNEPSIPAGWATDAQGRPTTDTRAASQDHLQWFGGHKGYGIAFFVEVMAGVLAGSSFGRTENTRSPVHGKDRVAKARCSSRSTSRGSGPAISSAVTSTRSCATSVRRNPSRAKTACTFPARSSTSCDWSASTRASRCRRAYSTNSTGSRPNWA
jgi:LDH2 family malate/lactate/ureidoglycolate dehydrogenase